MFRSLICVGCSQLLESYLKFPAVDAEMGLHVFLINASFAGAAGKGKTAATFLPPLRSRAASSSFRMSSSDAKRHSSGGIHTCAHPQAPV